MSPKTMVVIGIMLGSYVGGFVFNDIFGGNSLSLIGLFGNLIGGLGGAWLAWRFAEGS